MTAGLSNFGFDVDLRHGEATEQALIEELCRSRVEVKDERNQSPRTGNVFIEISQPDRHNPGERKPSGIRTSTAHRWAFRLRDDVWLIVPTDRLFSVTRQVFDDQGATFGGDYNDFEGVLVPVARLWRDEGGP